MQKNNVFEKSRKRQEELETDGPVGFQFLLTLTTLSKNAVFVLNIQ